MRNKKGRFTKGHQERLTHGLSDTSFHNRYLSMNNRCNLPKQVMYHRYGGRGIKVLWKDFIDFKKDMYISYLKHKKIHGERQTTIERIDNNGNYCKENCKWTTFKVQARNSSWNRILHYKGKSHCISEWAEILKIKPTALYARFERGWKIKRIFEQPFRIRRF